MDSETPNTPPDKSCLWNQLANVIALRSSEDQTLWASFGTFWATNAILLVALFTSGGFPSNPVVSFIIIVVGVVVSLVWYFIQRRALGHLQYHEALMQILEKELQFPQRLAISAQINQKLHEAHLRRGPRARTVMAWCSIGGAIAWVVAPIVVFMIAKLIG